MVKPEECPKLDDCPRIKMLSGYDLLEFQYAEAIRAVCARCQEKEVHDPTHNYIYP